MGMNDFYGMADNAVESIATIHRALWTGRDGLSSASADQITRAHQVTPSRRCRLNGRCRLVTSRDRHDQLA
jgi:hypothetical protein